MGRFYQTATPNKIDFMYQVPENQMFQALAATDKRIGDEENSIYDLYGKLQFQALSDDKERRQEIISGYEGEIDKLAKQFQENPLAYTNTKGVTRKLQREIHEDWTRGEVAAIQSNYNARTEFEKRYMEAVAKGDANASDLNLAMQYFDANFSGTNFNKELSLGKTYNTEELAKYVNMGDLAEKRGQGYIADFKKTTGAFEKNGYLYTSENSTNTIPYEDIYNGVLNSMKQDKELLDYYRQQIKFGKYTPEMFELMLMKEAARVAQKFNKDDKTGGLTSIKGDPFALQRQKAQLDKENHAWKKQYDNQSMIAVDRNNEQVTFKTTNGGKSVNEFEQKIKEANQDSKNMMEEFRAKLYKLAVDKADNSPQWVDLQRVKGDIDEAYQQALQTGNFEKLKAIAYNHGIGDVDKNGNYIGTGIDVIEEDWRVTQANVKNQQGLLDSIRNKELKRIQAEDEKDIESFANTFGKVLGEVEKENLRQFRRAELERTRTRRANEKVDEVLADDDFHLNNQSVYSTQGNYYDQLPVEQRGILKAYMDKVGEKFFEFVSADGRATATYIDANGKKVTRASNYNQLIQDNFIDHEQIEKQLKDPNQKYITIIGEGGKKITFEKGDVRIVPEHIPGNIGRNSYQLTLVAQGDVKGTNMPQSMTFYVPNGDIPASAPIKEVFKSQEANTLANELVRDAQLTYENGITKGVIDKQDAFYISPYAPGISYNAYSISKDGKGVAGEWRFQTEDGGVEIKYGNDGLQHYKQLLILSGKGAGWNETQSGEFNEFYMGKNLKSEGESKSKSTYK